MLECLYYTEERIALREKTRLKYDANPLGLKHMACTSILTPSNVYIVYIHDWTVDMNVRASRVVSFQLEVDASSVQNLLICSPQGAVGSMQSNPKVPHRSPSQVPKSTHQDVRTRERTKQANLGRSYVHVASLCVEE